MSWKGVIYQTLISSVIWGLAMSLVFGWPRETLLVPMAMFGCLMFAVLGTVKMFKDRRTPK